MRQTALLRDMEVVRPPLGNSYDLAEVYSPPRIAVEARRMKMRGGFSLDFTTPEPDGYIWDFSNVDCRTCALRRI